MLVWVMVGPDLAINNTVRKHKIDPENSGKIAVLPNPWSNWQMKLE